MDCYWAKNLIQSLTVRQNLRLFLAKQKQNFKQNKRLKEADILSGAGC